MAIISKKKVPYQVSENLRRYLKKYDRTSDLPIHYENLLRYENSVPLYDNYGHDTLWETVFYGQSDMADIHYDLKKIYSIIKAHGDVNIIEHLYIDRVDLCVFGNTKPFRIRIVNQVNDNFDYFYIKHADASRIYGLELEHLLSPNRISYVVSGQTLIEEHIIGIPGDQFMKYHLNGPNINEIRLAKEFVKFNERCFIRLLGDMHSSNFVVDVTPDFEEVSYRIRAIDFDQQSYEGRKSIYMPKYFKQNNPLIEIGLRNMTPETVRQYQKEEHSLMANRIRTERIRINDLIGVMARDDIAPNDNIKSLGKELAKHYKKQAFEQCKSMGELVRTSLHLLMENRKN
ncbi:MAG TPA: hypothetical protein ACFCUD_00715 [Cyclobacteriaceae bacterium]